MLKVRGEQIAHIGSIMFEQYRSDLSAYLAATYPESFHSNTDEKTVTFVTKGLTKAASYGITMESEITEFVERMVTYGKEFDQSGEYEWVEEILNNAEIPGNEKMGHIAMVELEAHLN